MEDKKVVFLKASIIAAQKHLQVQPQTQLDIRSFFYLLKVLKRLRKLNTVSSEIPSFPKWIIILCRWKDSSWSFDYVFKHPKLHFTYSMIHFEYMLNVAFLWNLLLHDNCAVQWLNIKPYIFLSLNGYVRKSFYHRTEFEVRYFNISNIS